MKRARLLRLASLGAVVFVLMAALAVRAVRTRGPAAASPAASTWRLAWEPGRAYVYTMSARTSQRARIGAGAAAQVVEGELDLVGQLVVRCLAAQGGKFTLGISLRELSTASLVVSGAKGLADAHELEGKELVVEMDDLGHAGRMLARKSDGATASYILQAMVTLLHVSLPEGPSASWELDEPALLGRAHARYRADASAAPRAAPHAPRSLAREHASYLSLLAVPDFAATASARVDGEDHVAFADDGALASVRVNEHVVVPGAPDARLVADVVAEFSLARRETFVREPIALAEMEEQKPGAVIGGADVRRAMLEQLAGNLTLARLESTLAAYGGGAKLESGFVTAAAAFLKLNPAYAGALVEMFERGDTNGAMQALVLDLLVSASTPAAQAALRDALASDAARRDPKMYPHLIQRLAFVMGPESATADFAFKLYTSSAPSSAHTAAAYALGSTMGALARSGSRAKVAAYDARMKTDLARARSPEQRVTVLAALGNAGLPENVTAIRAYARDESARVRKEAAIALRKTDVPEARGALLDLLGDGDASVARAALGSIGDQRVDGDRLRELARFASGRGYPGELNEGFLTIASGQSESRDAAAALARAVLAKTQDGRTQARARMILAALGAPEG